MNWKLWICVLIGVAVAHVAGALMIYQYHQMRHPHVPPPQPNFQGRTITYVDAKTGEKLEVVREFKVSTKFKDEPTPEPVPAKPIPTP